MSCCTRALTKKYISTNVFCGYIYYIDVISKDLFFPQAARDGLMDVVEGHLALEASRLNDTDEDGLTAMHHAARYNRINVLNRLVEAGGGMFISYSTLHSTQIRKRTGTGLHVLQFKC